jgi:hypothetical protein
VLSVMLEGNREGEGEGVRRPWQSAEQSANQEQRWPRHDGMEDLK